MRTHLHRRGGGGPRVNGPSCRESLPYSFYAFPRAPWGTATEFVAEAIRHNLLIIPGHVFSRRDTHFRISYAAAAAVLKRGLDVLRKLARTPGSTGLSH